MSEEGRPPKDILMRMLTERYPDEVAAILRELGYTVGERPADLPAPEPLDAEDAGSVLNLALDLLEESDAEAVDIQMLGHAWSSEASGPVLGMRVGQSLLVNVHSRDKCAGRPCVLHNPSDHHMRTWPLLWRGDRGIMERTCSHGIGHPDPDDMAYQRTLPNGDPGVHGCDGCCTRSVNAGDVAQ